MSLGTLKLLRFTRFFAFASVLIALVFRGATALALARVLAFAAIVAARATAHSLAGILALACVFVALLAAGALIHSQHLTATQRRDTADHHRRHRRCQQFAHMFRSHRIS